MEEQTLITLIGLAVTIVALCVAMASFLYLFARNVKKDLGKDIEQARAESKTQNMATREQLGEHIDQLDSRLATVEGKVDLMAKADDVREGFAMLRGSLDTLERRTFDIATGTAAES